MKCKACEIIENDELVKQMPMHTCGKDGPVEDDAPKTEPASEAKKQYWLAYGKDVDKYGTIWRVELTDGPHSTPDGPVQAMKIIQGIGLDRDKINPNYVMVTIEPVPNIKVKVNEEAIAINKIMLDHGKQR